MAKFLAPVELAPRAIVADKYELLRCVGRGGMGEVWSAHHRALGEDVAIKFLVPPEGVEHDDMLSRFQLEAQIAAHLSRRSRHIASVIDFGVWGGVTAYLVMELLDGEPLNLLIAKGQHRDLAFVSMIVGQIARGLTVAHAENVVHRDLKPANVMLMPGEEGGDPVLVKILDFGIGKLNASAGSAPSSVGGSTPAPHRHSTVVGAPLGTAEYMSPEQVRAIGDVDHRCDVWALGVLAYEALTGVCPFEGQSFTDTMFRVLTRTRDPVLTHRPDLPPETKEIFTRAFAEKLADRYQSATEFAEAIRSLASDGEAASPYVATSVNRESRAFAETKLSGARSQETSDAKTNAPMLTDSVLPRAPRSRKGIFVVATALMVGAGVLFARFPFWKVSSSPRTTPLTQGPAIEPKPLLVSETVPSASASSSSGPLAKASAAHAVIPSVSASFATPEQPPIAGSRSKKKWVPSVIATAATSVLVTTPSTSASAMTSPSAASAPDDPYSDHTDPSSVGAELP
ncbi:MAG: serine/threonine-protein kinase [Polyangiales bacterium]